MATSTKKDFLERSAGFLDALDQVSNEGFFDNLSAQLSIPEGEGTETGIEIRLTGYLPSDERYKRAGIKLFVDVQNVVSIIRDQVSSNEATIRLIQCKVETGDWPLWDKKGQNVIGSRGNKVNLSLLLQLERRRKKKVQ